MIKAQIVATVNIFVVVGLLVYGGHSVGAQGEHKVYAVFLASSHARFGTSAAGNTTYFSFQRSSGEHHLQVSGCNTYMTRLLSVLSDISDQFGRFVFVKHTPEYISRCALQVIFLILPIAEVRSKAEPAEKLDTTQTLLSSEGLERFSAGTLGCTGIAADPYPWRPAGYGSNTNCELSHTRHSPRPCPQYLGT